MGNMPVSAGSAGVNVWHAKLAGKGNLSAPTSSGGVAFEGGDEVKWRRSLVGLRFGVDACLWGCVSRWGRIMVGSKNTLAY